MTGPYKTIGLMLGFVLVWTATETIVGTLLQQYPTLQIVWLHYLVMLVMWAALVGIRSPRKLLITQKPATQIFRAVSLLLMPVSWIIASRAGFGHMAQAAFWGAPFLVLMFTAILLRERSSLPTWLAAAAGSIAAITIYAQGASVPSGLEWFAVLGMPVAFSMLIVLSRVLRSETMNANLFYLTAGIVVILTPLIPEIWVALKLQHLIHFAVAGVLGLLALWLLDRSAFTASPGPVSPLLLAPVPLAYLVGWLTDNGEHNLQKLALLAITCIACATPLLFALNTCLKRNRE
jgi:drug/metabolite transporter (DMT)-like permease